MHVRYSMVRLYLLLYPSRIRHYPVNDCSGRRDPTQSVGGRSHNRGSWGDPHGKIACDARLMGPLFEMPIAVAITSAMEVVSIRENAISFLPPQVVFRSKEPTSFAQTLGQPVS